MASVSPRLAAFEHEATQSLVPDWVRIIIRPEFAPWALTVHAARAWLLAPAQQTLLEAAALIWDRAQQGACGDPTLPAPVAPLILDVQALALRDAPGRSVLELLNRKLEIDTAHVARNLSVSALVRVDAACPDELRVSLINGAVRFEDLRRHPNVFDAAADVAEVWPDAEDLSAILLGSTDVFAEVQRDGQDVRVRYRRTLADGTRLWIMAGCPDDPSVPDPRDEVEKQVQQVQKLLQNRQVQLLNAGPAGSTVLVATSYRRCTDLVSAASSGSTTIITRQRVNENTRITLSPGRRIEEMRQVVRVDPHADRAAQYELTLANALNYGHPACSPVRTAGAGSVQWYYQAQVTIAISNSDRTTTLWQPVTFVQRQDDQGEHWRFDDVDPFVDDTAAAGAAPDDPAALVLRWDPANLVLDGLPALQFTGTDNLRADTEMIWQPCVLSVAGTDQPPAWIRHHLADAEAHLAPTDAASRSFSRPVVLQWTDEGNVSWTIEGQPFDAVPKQGVYVSLDVAYHDVAGSDPVLDAITLTVNSPQVVVRSPQVAFYTPQVPSSTPSGDSAPDPTRLGQPVTFAVPAIRQWTAADFTSGSLCFHNLVPIGSVRFELTKAQGERRFRFQAGGDALRAYLPRPRAVIDLVSAAQANINALNEDTTLRVARDPSHGLLTFQVNQCELSVIPGSSGTQSLLKLTAPTLAAGSIPRATLALNPWVELLADNSLVAAQRNLVLEKMEYAVSSRFQSSPSEEIPAGLAVERALDVVRGRLSAASGPLTPATAQPLQGWLPGVVLHDSSGSPITPTLTWQDDSPAPPRLELTNGLGQTTSLSIESNFDATFAWMKVAAAWTDPEPSRPVVALKPATASDLNPAHDGWIPWLFSSRGIVALAANDEAVAAACAAGLFVWRRRAAAAITTLAHPTAALPVIQVALAQTVPGPAANLVVSVTNDGDVRGWTLTNPAAPVWTASGWIGAITPGQTRLALSAQGVLLVGGADGTARIVDGLTGTVTQTIAGTGDPVIHVAFVTQAGQTLFLVVRSSAAHATATVYDATATVQWQEPLSAPAVAATVAQRVSDAANVLWTTSGAQLSRTTLFVSPADTVLAQTLPNPITALAAVAGQKLSLLDQPQQVVWLSLLLAGGSLTVFAYSLQTAPAGEQYVPQIVSAVGPDDAGVAVTMPQSSSGATGWLALADGAIVQWDATSGRSMLRTPVPAPAVLDNAGAVRDLEPAIPGDPTTARLRVDRVNFASDNGASRSAVALLRGAAIIALDGQTLPADPRRVTDLRLRAQGVPIDTAFHVLDPDSTLPNSGYAFFSQVSGPTDGSKVVDAWPRFLGVPLRVVRLKTCAHDAAGTLTRLVFDAVVPAPTDIEELDETASEPAFVAEAIRRGNLAEFTIAGPFPIASLAQVQVRCASEWNWSIPPIAAPSFPNRRFSAQLQSLFGKLVLEGGRLLFRPSRGEVGTLGLALPLDGTLPELITDGTAHEFGFTSATWNAEVTFPAQGTIQAMAACATQTSLLVIAGDNTGGLAQLDLLAERDCRHYTQGSSANPITAVACRPSTTRDTGREIPHLVAGDSTGGLWRVPATLVPTAQPGQVEKVALESLPQVAAPVLAVAISATDPTAVFGADGNRARRFSGDAVPAVLDYPTTAAIRVIQPAALGPTGYVFAGCADGRLFLFEEADPSHSHAEPVATAAISAIAVSESIDTILVGDAGGTIQLLGIASLASPSFSVLGHFTMPARVTAVALATIDGRRGCVAVSGDGTVCTFWLDPVTDPLVPRFTQNYHAAASPLAAALTAGDSARVIALLADATWRVFAAHPDITLRADLDPSPARHSVALNAPLTSPTSAGGGPVTSAAVRTGARLDLRLNVDGTLIPALPGLEEDGTYAFAARVARDDWTEGEILLALWSEPLAGSLAMGGLQLREGATSRTLAVNTALNLAGELVELGLQYSVPETAAGATTLVWNEARFCGGILQGSIGPAEVELLLADQLFSLMYDGAMQPLSISAMLRVEPSSTATSFQAPLTLELTQSALSDTVIPALLRAAVYLPQPRGALPIDDDHANLIVPLVDHPASVQIAPSAVPSVPIPGFVLLTLTAAGFQLQTLPRESVPFDPCLEPSSQAPVPLQPDWVPRLIHRLGQGAFLDVRVATLSSFQPQSLPLNAPRFVPGSHAGRDPEDILNVNVDIWNLRLVAFDPALSFPGILAYSVDLLPMNSVAGSVVPAQSENVLVLHRGRHQAAIGRSDTSWAQRELVPLASLINASADLSSRAPGSGGDLLSSDTIQSQLLTKGAAGLAVHRLVRPGRAAVFAWVASPFAGQVAISDDPSRAAVVAAAGTAALEIDARSLQPATSAGWSLDAPCAYVLSESRHGGQAGDSGWYRNMGLTVNGSPPADLSRLPCLRITERPLWNAFNEPPNWLTAPAPIGPHGFPFVPQFVDWWATSDKAGATLFQSASLMFEQTGSPDLLQPSAPAMGISRDPQQFIAPEGAGLAFLSPLPSWAPSPVVPGGRDVTMQWRETICRLDLSGLNLSATLKIVLDSAAHTFSLDPDPNTKRALTLSSRVNEHLYATGLDVADLPIETDNLRLESERIPDLYVASPISDVGDPRTPTGSADQFKLFVRLVLAPDGTAPLEFEFHDFFEPVAVATGTFSLWKLDRAFVQSLAQPIPWFNSPTDRVQAIELVFKQQVAMSPVELILLRTVVRPSPASPLTAKLAFALVAEGAGTRDFERTLLFGDAASSQGIADIDQALGTLIFSRQDQDAVTAFPPSAMLAGHTWRLYLVKSFTSGAILTTSAPVS
jgi:hypothetical protein